MPFFFRSSRVSPILLSLRYRYSINPSFSLWMALVSILTRHLMPITPMTLILSLLLTHPFLLFISLILKTLFAQLVTVTFSICLQVLILGRVCVRVQLVTYQYRIVSRCLLFSWQTTWLTTKISPQNPFILFDKATFKDITLSSHLSTRKWHLMLLQVYISYPIRSV